MSPMHSKISSLLKRAAVLGQLRRGFLLATVVFGWAVTSPAAPPVPIAIPEPVRRSETPSAGLLNSMALLNDAHKLGPGDQVSLRVIEDEDPPVRLSVADSGEIEIPLLGRV